MPLAADDRFSVANPPSESPELENDMKPTTEFLTKFSLCLAVWGTAICLADNKSQTTRPQLQIINGSSQTIDVFWLKSDNDRVSNGSVAPGKNTIISTTIGHRFVVVGCEDKSEAMVTS